MDVDYIKQAQLRLCKLGPGKSSSFSGLSSILSEVVLIFEVVFFWKVIFIFEANFIFEVVLIF